MVKEHEISIWKIALAVLLLAGSTFIYLVFRADNIIGYRLVYNLGLSGMLDSVRTALGGVNLPEFVIYSLPDGLWLVSYMLLVDSLLPYHPTKPLWMLALPANAIVSEVAQYWHLLPGNFDVWDLICYVIPTSAYLIFRRAEFHRFQTAYGDIMWAPPILVTYLFLAGCSVERLDTPFVITCAIYSSILIALSYGVSMTFPTLKRNQ